MSVAILSGICVRTDLSEGLKMGTRLVSKLFKLVIFTVIVSTRAAGTVPPNFTREIYLKTSSQSLSPRERYN